MTYLKRSNRPRSGKAATAAVIAFLVIIFGLSRFFPGAFPSVIYPAASVFWKAESATVGWFVYMGKIVQSKYSLVVENRRLSDLVAAQDRSLLILDGLKSENEDLKNMLGRTGKADFVLGVILSRPPVSPYDTLVVDVGASDGVSVGDKVYAEGDTLVGDVAEVYGGQSKVSLFSAPGRSVQVLVGSTTIAAEAIGRGDGNFVLKLPAHIMLEKGSLISLPGVRPHVFGTVDGIQVDSSDSLQTVYFRTPVNLSQLPYVEIDRGSAPLPQATTSPAQKPSVQKKK